MSNFKKYLNNVQQMRYNEEDENVTRDDGGNVTFIHKSKSFSQVFDDLKKISSDMIKTILTGDPTTGIREHTGIKTYSSKEYEELKKESKDSKGTDETVDNFKNNLDNTTANLKKIISQKIASSQKNPELVKKLNNELALINKFQSELSQIKS